jgi:hypothetical protein
MIFATVVAGLVVSGCGPHSSVAAPGSGPSGAGSGAPSASGTAVPGTDVPSASGAAGASRSPRALPGIGIAGTVPCLTSRQHFTTEADRAIPQVCLRVGGAFDLTTMRPETSVVTQVTSSDPGVLACGAPRPTVCQARKAGQSIVTAVDGGGQWRVAVFVGG